MTTIHNLPVEMLPMIFRYLGIHDLNRTRLVSKLWNFYCNKQIVEELIIKKRGSTLRNQWFHTQKSIESDNIILMDPFEHDFLVFSVKLINCSFLNKNLKRLKICNDNFGFNCGVRVISQLYKFNQLEQLDLELNYLDENSALLISHSNLKILNLNFSFWEGHRIDIDAEKLKYCYLGGELEYANFVYPKSVLHLYTRFSGEFIDWSKFENLQFLNFLNFYDIPDSVILSQLSKLEIIEFNTTEGLTSWADKEFYSSMKISMIELIEFKAKLNLNNLKIYFNEIELTDVQIFKRIFRSKFYFDSESDESMETNDSHNNSQEIIEDNVIIID